MYNLWCFCPVASRLCQSRSLHRRQQVTALCVLHPSSSGIQACYNNPVMLCDRPGRAVAVCVNPDQSLPLLDGQRHQRAERSQGALKPGLMRWVLRSAQRCEHPWLTTCIFMRRKKNKTKWLKGGHFSWLLHVFLDSPMTGNMSKVLRLFSVLIDIPVGRKAPRMSCIWQGLYSLMIRVNMAHSLHSDGEVERNNTIAKIQPICEKKQQETALNGPECTAPEGATSITVTRPKRRTLGEVIAKMEMAVCVCLCMCDCVCVLFFFLPVCGLEEEG